jgi:NAD(P)-dependent dehydrogenase (short-subunit alcohol dehydrogenase family)
MITFAADKATARIAGEFYINAINVMRGAEAVSAYQPIPESEKFRIEYWELEEAKLRRRPQPKPLAGRVALVTGGGSGIGRATAQRLAAEGACVVVADRDAGRLESVAKDIKGVAVACDVAKEADIRHLIAEAERHYGPVDVFFSNAGIGRGGHEDALDKDWADSWAIHVMAHVYAARALMPGMLQRKSGYLLNTASAAGLLASMGSAPYGVTKHAAVALAEHLSIQYGDKGISVSVLCPQAVDTNMLRMAGATAASVDGVLNTDAVAQTVIDVMDAETFLILPHPDVLQYMTRKTGDIDRWLRGMRRLRDKSGEGQARRA